MTKARRAAALVAVSAGLASCSGADEPEKAGAPGLVGPHWQIVAVYTDPNTPGGLPQDAAGKATLDFGASSMKGLTGCAPLRATTTTEGDQLRLDEVEVADPGDCIGGARYVHDQLTGLLAPGATFRVRHLGPREALLTALEASEGVEAPSIRVMAL
ncbi:hypothetical protein [Corynebacterium timonense]|uniref:META domain-containing protein n=1 Tax=Corynebacterium timonense TaxID=441500 RepID=A0A1H1L9S8_9CORY|nr:hypothetical protein [Corynebacterium timonense]SDR70639.1 hypothetical protein SAMN04488539_0099 [Corynebacterium timonense]